LPSTNTPTPDFEKAIKIWRFGASTDFTQRDSYGIIFPPSFFLAT